MIRYSLFIILLALFTSCSDQKEKMRIIMDTDANNELDDQHALAYLLANDDYFDIEGITVNTTSDGKEYTDIDLHYDEAQRIITLMNKEKRVKIYKGATQSFLDIRDKIGELEFDGFDAVNFIIDRAKATGDRLVLLPIGKLTNIALALLKEPSIIPNIRIVWLGSNYPNPGEYNQDNDPLALQYILGTNVDFELAIVRYGEPSGTDAVKVYVAEIEEIMPGKGPILNKSIIGRHGGDFNNFGDYSVNLFRNYKENGNPPSRPLFDMAAVAILKNSSWADSVSIPKPELFIKPVENGLGSKALKWNNGIWIDKPKNTSYITIWENFKSNEIIKDFFSSFESNK